MQVEVRDIGPVVAGTRDAHLRVHVGSIEIDLPAVPMDDLADLADALFKHPVRRGIGDHDGRELVGVLRGLGFQIGDVDAALRVTSDRHHFHARHVGRGRIRAVRRHRNEADFAVGIAAAGVIAANRQQARVLALGARVGLQRDRVVAGDRTQLLLEMREHFAIAGRLAFGSKRMQVAELGPGDRDHFGGGVELHGARSQGDHGAVQRQVAIGELAHVAQNVGLRAIAMEHRMLAERRFAP